MSKKYRIICNDVGEHAMVKSELRKNILLLALGMVAVIGLASAALLSYYGQISSTTEVAQSVKLDGMTCTGISGEGCVVAEGKSGVAGTQIHGNTHNLTNSNPELNAIVSLESIATDAIGLTVVPKYLLEPGVASGQGLNDDEDDLHMIRSTPISWGDFANVSFWYQIASGVDKTPHVNIRIWNSDKTASCLKSASLATVVAGTWNSTTYNKGDFSDVTGACPGADNWTTDRFTIEVGNPGADNIAADIQVVWVKNPRVNGENLTWFGVPNANFGNVPARTVGFRMGYDFAMNALAKPYVVNTSVTPRGTYAFSGVYFP